ncbi:MAG: rRNA adenine N(6)-methyltransferase family protein [Solirubrobacteraceae bacterium MAG38_C4-C5]|nr:rRNA adenine N(6)-methyltransferase family protein [Candidatus Siliceabacter maunaloa]
MGARRRRPSTALGAHYLNDPKLAAQLVETGQVSPGDLVLDLGAGAGALTAPLARAGAEVVAIERDPRLARKLRRRFETARVVVLEADLLAVALPRRPYRVVASIPFGITTSLLGRLLDPPGTALERAVLVVEWGAGKGFSDLRCVDPRILWWKARFDLHIARRLEARCFNPPPGVDAAVLVADRRPLPLVPPRHHAPFLGLLVSTLGDPRAPAGKALAPIFSKRQLRRLLGDRGIGPDVPVGVISIEQWAAITAAMVALVDPARWPRRTPAWSPSHRGRRRRRTAAGKPRPEPDPHGRPSPRPHARALQRRSRPSGAAARHCPRCDPARLLEHLLVSEGLDARSGEAADVAPLPRPFDGVGVVVLADPRCRISGGYATKLRDARQRCSRAALATAAGNFDSNAG